MPFFRLATAAALTLVLVIPSAASAQTPQPINALRTAAPSASSQADMLRLQALMNQHTQAAEMLSSMTQKFAQMQDQIARNLR